MRGEIKTGLLALAAGLQSMVDCIWLGVPDNVTPAIVVAVVLIMWYVLIGRQQLQEERRRQQKKRRRNHVPMYNLKEIATPDWPMIEI